MKKKVVSPTEPYDNEMFFQKHFALSPTEPNEKIIPAKDPNRLCFSSLNENIIKKIRRRKRRRYNSDYDKLNIANSRISTKI